MTTQETPEARTRRCNAAQARQQVPAGDAAALAEYKRTHPWANITPPEIVEPYRSPQQIEEDNRVRKMLADQQGRIAHGEGMER